MVRVLSAILAVVAVVCTAVFVSLLLEVSQEAFNNPAYPMCGWFSGPCGPEYTWWGTWLSYGVVFSAVFALFFTFAAAHRERKSA